MLDSTKLVGTPSDQTVKETTVSKISAGALNAMQRNALSGVVKSIAIYCMNNGLDRTRVKAKLVTLVNAMLAAKDINESDADWMMDYWFGSIFSKDHADPECVADCYDWSTMHWYTILDNLCNDSKVDEWCFDVSENLSDEEKKVIADLRNTRSAYCAAQNKFDEYFRRTIKEAVVMVLRKYATTMTQIAPDWFKMAAKLAGILDDTKASDVVTE